MFKWLQERTSRKDAKPAVASLLHVTIGRTVEIDSMAYGLWPEDCLIEVDPPVMTIVAQGHADLGEGSHLHRFYPDEDHLLLQMQGGDGVDSDRVDEIMLWSYHDVRYPADEADWNRIKESIRQPKFILRDEEEDIHFDRAWFDTTPGPQDPITYWETVYDDRSGSESRRIYQTAMLFARRLSDEQDEFLLVNMEEPESGDRCISYMVGRPITQHQFKA